MIGCLGFPCFCSSFSLFSIRREAERKGDNDDSNKYFHEGSLLAVLLEVYIKITKNPMTKPYKLMGKVSL